MKADQKLALFPGAARTSPAVSPALSSWNFCLAKRVLDIIFSFALLLLTSPLWLLTAAAIKLTSRGPVFFQQVRSGQNGREFQLLKFRSMAFEAGARGPDLTQAGDQRVTRVGRRLRQWKLDELPQLWNVLRGEMTMVGPRPDLPHYLASLPASQSAVVSLRPGVTGAASLEFRSEESVLAQVPAVELKQFYMNELLPRKAALDLEYARQATFFTDLNMIWRTALAVLGRE